VKGLRTNRSAIVAGSIASELELSSTLEMYRQLDDLAPLAVSQEWSTLLNAIETANTVVPGDPDGIQRVAEAAYQSEAAALAIAEWAMASCDVDSRTSHYPCSLTMRQNRRTPVGASS
jgi:hypothetical protein